MSRFFSFFCTWSSSCSAPFAEEDFVPVCCLCSFVRDQSAVFLGSVFCSSDLFVFTSTIHCLDTVALCKASLSSSRIALALLGLSPLFISEICRPARCLSPQVLQGADTTFQMGRRCNRDPHTRAELERPARG